MGLTYENGNGGLRQKMGSATNEADRQAIQRTISMLEME